VTRVWYCASGSEEFGDLVRLTATEVEFLLKISRCYDPSTTEGADARRRMIRKLTPLARSTDYGVNDPMSRGSSETL
jgi:hypothetical protein